MKIDLPHVGESVTEGIIGRWLKHVGDPVEKYEPIVEVITDKVNMEVPAPATGIITNILVEEGSTVPMGTAIAEMSAPDEDAIDNTASPKPTSKNSPPMDRVGSLMKDVAPVGPTGSGGPITTNPGRPPSQTSRYSPAVLRLADQQNVDLSMVIGTGINGRVTRNDVQAFIDSQEQQPGNLNENEELVQLTPIRRMIAENMANSTRTIPEAWTLVEADVTNLVQLREQTKTAFFKRENANLTYLAFIVKIVADCLKEHQMVNASWNDNTIILKKRVNIGVAVAAPGGLVVPVVHDADRLDVSDLAKSIQDLANRARSGKLSLKDVQGGTFTINNTGALGSIIGKAIINSPEAAILNTESIVNRPVVIDNTITIRSMMNLCLTFDHRILDGAEAGAFIGDMKRRLEAIDPNLEV